MFYSTRSISTRPLSDADEPFLWEIVYHAIYLPAGVAAPPRSIVQHPKIAKYVRGWGNATDLGFAAVIEGSVQPVGAAWLRLLRGEQRGYGYVADDIPELTVALLPRYRGAGTGTHLLTHLLDAAQQRFPGVSLSVSPENPALRLYQRLGFQVVNDSGSSWTMLKRWDHPT